MHCDALTVLALIVQLYDVPESACGNNVRGMHRGSAVIVQFSVALSCAMH